MKKILILLIFAFSFHSEEAVSQYEEDPFEDFNRIVFNVADRFDNAVLRPTAEVYSEYTPTIVKDSVSNFFNNLSEVDTIANQLLQGKFKLAIDDTFRFFINSTFGIAGIFDPANSFGFEKREKEDFGQTLGVMGVEEGCYLVLPVLGPTTIRDTVGSFVAINGGDVWHNITVRDDEEYVKEFKESDYWASRITSGVDFRAKNLEAFDAMEKNSVDLYATVRLSLIHI